MKKIVFVLCLGLCFPLAGMAKFQQTNVSCIHNTTDFVLKVCQGKDCHKKVRIGKTKKFKANHPIIISTQQPNFAYKYWKTYTLKPNQTLELGTYRGSLSAKIISHSCY